MASLSFLHVMLLSPTILLLSDFHIVPPLGLVKSISHSCPFASYVAAETKPMGRVAAQHPLPCCSMGFESLTWIASAGQGRSIWAHMPSAGWCFSCMGWHHGVTSSGLKWRQGPLSALALLCFCWPGYKVKMMLIRAVWVLLPLPFPFHKSRQSDLRAG